MALPLFTFSEPGPAPITQIGNFKFTLWDSFEFNNPTASEIVVHFKNKYNIKISSMSIGQYMLLSPFINKENYKTRLSMKVKDIYYQITNTEPTNPFMLSIIMDSEDSEDSDEDYNDDENLPDCKIYY